ncbi:SDR family NAD(P)-dependent oxidoreductase [Patulibacter sp. S7RM1-6]
MTTDPSAGIPTAAADPAHRFAVVTGASRGIGLELAKQFAQNGFDVLVAAEDAEIEAIPGQLRAHGQHAEAVRVDLATKEGVDELYGRIRAVGRPVDALALNAGVGVGGGRFVDTPVEDHLRLVELNVNHVVHLARHVLPGMVDRGEGRVLITSSIAAKMPGPYYATYAASKSFVHAFGEALRTELADTGVTVTALQPGPTDTDFFDRAGMQDTRAAQGPKSDPEQVAKEGFEALMAGKDAVAVGLQNKIQSKLGEVLPDKVAARVHGVLSKPKKD